MKRSILVILFILVTSVSTVFAASVEETNIVKTVGDLGSDSALGYFGLIEGFKVPTKYNLVYVDLSTDWGKAQYQLLLTAKTHNLKIKRIVYDYDENNPDTIYKLHLITLW